MLTDSAIYPSITGYLHAKPTSNSEVSASRLKLDIPIKTNGEGSERSRLIRILFYS